MAMLSSWRVYLAIAVVCFAVGFYLASQPHPVFPKKNWSLEHTFEPEFYHEPATIEELREILRNASSSVPPRHVKVVGAGHSWSDIAKPQGGHFISMHRFSQVLHVDKGKLQVTAEAGITLMELKEVLAAHNMSFIVLPSISFQTLAGALSTATHATGVNFTNMATQIISVKLMTASGEILQISSTENSDLFQAVRCGLGSLGIILEITLQCTDLFYLHSTETPMPNEHVLQNFDAISQSADHVKIWWIPHAGFSQVFRFNRTELPENDPEPQWKRELSAYIMEWPELLCGYFPSLSRVVSQVAHLGFVQKERVARSDRVFNIPFHVTEHNEMEFAVPREQCGALFQQILAYVDDHYLQINHIIEIRFVKADDIWLSPDYQRDACHFLLLYFPGMRNRHYMDQYFSAFEQMALEMGGRPHWAKTFTTATTEKLPSLYPRWDEFVQVQKRLDPQRIFFNEYLERVFGKQ